MSGLWSGSSGLMYMGFLPSLLPLLFNTGNTLKWDYGYIFDYFDSSIVT